MNDTGTAEDGHNNRKRRMNVEDKASDRRNSRREPAYDISEICFTGGRPPVTCLVHNVSGVGARLEAATGELPSHFILANHARRLRAVCQVVWRDGTLFGVRFLTPPRQMA